MSQDRKDTFSSMWMISPLTGTRFTLKKWRSSRRPVERSYRINRRVSMSVRSSLLRLSPIVIQRGRRSDKKSETTEGEKRQLRAVWGPVNWSNERPVQMLSALKSLGMGSLNHSTVQDLCDANMAVERLKAEPFLGVKLPHIPIHHVRWATVQDATWANAAEDHSQGGFLVGATSPRLWNNLPSPSALLSHKSRCLKRKCSSASAAEPQIMSEALAEVEWIRGLLEELTNPNFSIVEWAARSRNRGLLIAARSTGAESIGDAKSLYNHLRTETSDGANDRRAAIDSQIIRARMDALGATVRWAWTTVACTLMQ